MKNFVSIDLSHHHVCFNINIKRLTIKIMGKIDVSSALFITNKIFNLKFHLAHEFECKY